MQLIAKAPGSVREAGSRRRSATRGEDSQRGLREMKAGTVGACRASPSVHPSKEGSATVYRRP